MPKSLKDALKNLTPEEREELKEAMKEDGDSDFMGTLEALKKRVDALEGKGKGKPPAKKPWWETMFTSES